MTNYEWVKQKIIKDVQNSSVNTFKRFLWFNFLARRFGNYVGVNIPDYVVLGKWLESIHKEG